MIALDVELLTGRYVATRFNDRNAPEWPPHPARLFSALVATAHEHDEITADACRALEWLERQGAPRVLASDAEPRAVIPRYVSENTTRVLSGWSGREDKLQQARQELAAAEQEGDAKRIKKAQKGLKAAEKAFDEALAKAVADDGKHNASSCKTALEMLPQHRDKQPLTLPSVTPEQPRVRYVWPAAVPDARTGEVLSDLGGRLVRLGHSSSLVTCRVVGNDTGSEPLQPDAAVGLREWIPADDGSETLRSVGEGQLASLGRAFERHQGFEPRVLPAVHQRYRRAGGVAGEEPVRSVFGEWIVFREVAPPGGRRVGLRLQRTEDITRALRGALLSHADDPPPEVLAGHTGDGRPLERPHVGFVALADVGSRHASGTVLGAAIVLPREIEANERRAVLRAIGRWEESGLRLTLGRVGVLALERVVDGDPRKTLDPGVWCRPSKRWASVTPVALDENPGDLFSRDPAEVGQAVERAEEIVARSCERIGLPRPRWVEVMRRSLFDAAPAARQFMPFPKKKGKSGAFRRVCVHVEMRFDVPVEGAVMLGAGRYFGVGVCRPRGEGW